MRIEGNHVVYVVFLWNATERRWDLAAFVRGLARLTLQRCERLRRKQWCRRAKPGKSPMFFATLDHVALHGPPREDPTRYVVAKPAATKPAPVVPRQPVIVVEERLPDPTPVKHGHRDVAISQPIATYSLRNVTYGPRVIDSVADLSFGGTHNGQDEEA